MYIDSRKPYDSINEALQSVYEGRNDKFKIDKEASKKDFEVVKRNFKSDIFSNTLDNLIFKDDVLPPAEFDDGRKKDTPTNYGVSKTILEISNPETTTRQIFDELIRLFPGYFKWGELDTRNPSDTIPKLDSTFKRHKIHGSNPTTFRSLMNWGVRLCYRNKLDLPYRENNFFELDKYSKFEINVCYEPSGYFN